MSKVTKQNINSYPHDNHNCEEVGVTITTEEDENVCWVEMGNLRVSGDDLISLSKLVEFLLP